MTEWKKKKKKKKRNQVKGVDRKTLALKKRGNENHKPGKEVIQKKQLKEG